MDLGELIRIIFVLGVIGFALYALNAWVPMAAPIKTVINVIVVVALIIFVLIWALGIDVIGGHHMVIR